MNEREITHAKQVFSRYQPSGSFFKLKIDFLALGGQTDGTYYRQPNPHFSKQDSG